MELNILICGIGGQGVVFLGSFLRNYFLGKYPNAFIMGTESRGVSQREGSVIASIRIQTDPDPQKIFSPEIPPMSADVVIALEPLELLRNLHVVNKKTIIVTNNEPIIPKSSAKWMMRDTSDKDAFNVHSHSKPSWLIAQAEKFMNSIPINVDRIEIPRIKNEMNSNLDQSIKIKSFSNYHGIFDLNFSSLILDELEDSSNLNLVLLGFLATIIAPILDIEGLQSFIDSNSKREERIKIKNKTAIEFGANLAAEYAKMKKSN